MQTIEKLTEIDFAPPATAPAEAAMVPVTTSPELPATLAPEAATIFQIIERAARDPSVDIDKMERLILMQERVQARQAQLEYDTAMRTAQEGMKRVRADAENKQTHSQYATYGALDRAIRPAYTANGFSLSFGTGEGPPDHVRVECCIAHVAGHREKRHIDMPADGRGAKGGEVMTRTHATGAAITYGKRYLLGMIFNIAIGEDDDGNGASGDWVDEAARDGLLRNGERRSTYDVVKVEKAKELADKLVQSMNLAPNAQGAKELLADSDKIPPGKKKSPLGWLKDNSPGQYHRVKMAYENVTGEELE